MDTVNNDHIQRAFEQFHEDNPHVLRELEMLATDWFAHGHDRVAIGMLWEVIRWARGVDTTADQFKLNNNFRSRYARLMVERNPEWAGRFELRALASERIAA